MSHLWISMAHDPPYHFRPWDCGFTTWATWVFLKHVKIILYIYIFFWFKWILKAKHPIGVYSAHQITIDRNPFPGERRKTRLKH